MKYRVGWPGWRLLAQVGVPMHIAVNVHWDAETKSFWADSPDIDGLIVSGSTPEELRDEVIGAASGLLSCTNANRRVIPDMSMSATAAA